jgi:hypothetical protein
MSEICLKYPVQLASGKTLGKLTLRRAKVADLREASSGGASQEDQEVALLARLSGLLPEDVLELDLADYKALQDAFRSMLD